jgi:hypothetical protein
MLLGKLLKKAYKVYQEGPFETTTAYADYIVVSTQKYVIGSDKVSFELRFGNIVIENEKERFDKLMEINLLMTSEELSTWGTDDSVLLDLIAEKINNTITEKVNKDLHHTY